MQEILANPITWIVIAAASEIIGLSPLKSNTVVQVILKAILQLKPSVKKSKISLLMMLYLLHSGRYGVINNESKTK